jgi:uncharacterized protein
MRVNIDEIKEGGLERAWDLGREVVDDLVKGVDAGYRARSALHVEGRLQRLERRVLFQARARAPLTTTCGRCLAPVDLEVPVDFQLTFVPEEEPEPEESGGARRDQPTAHVAGSFGSDDVNEEGYTGKTIDLDPVVREQLLLALPGYPVCKESCKGLCSACGANLNEGDCGCNRHVPDPRWAGLEKFKRK